MRKLVRIFMTVVAGMMVFSCATDTTDDLTASVGKGQKTVISASLEESRTQLGEYNKDAKKYPMYWSAGDKISANGVVSEAAVISEADAAVASFEFPANANLKSPYFVAYPAVANAEGKWQVKFAAEQKWTMENDTFDEGVSTMYGYSEEGLNVTMNHLTGILKIGITGSEMVILEKVQISTADRKPIAGTFDFAFETDAKGNKVPKLTPTADAKSVIEYSFGNVLYDGDTYIEGGQSLSSNPTYIHVAVPAGIYDELYVTLYDIEGGVMYATVKADDTKPLKAGQVREFKKDDAEQLIEYTPADVYIVSDAGTLAGVKENLDKTVVMVADVDMSSVIDWKSIENFSGSFYGNGYAIKGLKAPLFGTTTASVIKGVHLENVAITTNGGAVGALVCFINSEDSVVEYCSVTGTVTVNNETRPATVNGGGHFYGSMIGLSISTQKFSNLTTNVTLTLKGSYLAFRAANCIGDHRYGKLENVTSLGTLTYNGAASDTCYLGGVTAYCFKGMLNCVNGDAKDTTGNKGSITIDTKTGQTVCVGGVTSYYGATMERCINYGSINIKGELKSVLVGGLALRAADGNDTEFSYCENRGKITFDVKSATSIKCGGLLMDNWKSSKTLDYCYNYGDIEFAEGSKCTGGVYLGGLLGVNEKTYKLTFNNCNNYGVLSFKGYGGADVGIGGLIGSTSKVNLTLSNCENKGDITASGTIASGMYVYAGGVCGITTQPIKNAGAFCTITASGHTNVGMLTGSAYSTAIAATNCKVGGSIKKGDATEAVTLTGENYYNYIYGSGNPTTKPAESVCVYWDGTEE